MKNSVKKIKAFIRPAIAARITMWTSFLLAIVAFLIGGYFIGTADREVSEKFDSINSPKSTYCYIDVVGVSDWLYESTYDSDTTVYYAVEDAEGYLYIATIESEDYEKMTAQQEFWDREDGNAVMPEPYRLEGSACYLDPDKKVRTNLAESFGIDPEDEFEAYFGNMMLDGDYNPREQKGYGFWLASMFLGLFWVVVVGSNSKQIKNTRKSIKALKKSGKIDEAAEELDNGELSCGCVITAHYLFVKWLGIAIDYNCVKKCTVFRGVVYLSTETLGEIGLKIGSNDVISKLLNALPLKEEQVEQPIVLGRE